MTPEPVIRSLTPAEGFGCLDALAEVYAETFRAPPWNETAAEVAEFRSRLPEHLNAPGWRCRVAERDGAIVGFSYGVQTPDPLPEDRAYPRVRAAVGPRVAELSGALEVLELAVAPTARRIGLGRRLLDSIVEPAPPLGAWLLTIGPAVEAVALYERSGWHLLGAEPSGSLRVFQWLSEAASPQ